MAASEPGFFSSSTVMLAMAGKKYVNQLKSFTPVIKQVSAVALILVGVYLVYFFYSAWGI